MSVLEKPRVVKHCAIQSEMTEPATGKIEMHLAAQPGLGADAEGVADERDADFNSGSIEGRPMDE